MTVRSLRHLVLLALLGTLPPHHGESGSRAAEAGSPGDPAARARQQVTLTLEAGCLSEARRAAYAALVEDGSELFALHPDRPMIPASTQKLFTAVTALHLLGPARTLETRFMATGPLGPDGVLAGDLVVRGGGAPDLTASELWAAVRELKARGLATVDGDLVADDSAHTPPGRPPGWPGAENQNPYNAAGGALGVNWNALRVDVAPGPVRGSPVRVSLFPLESVAQVVVGAHTGGSRSRISLNRRLVEGTNRISVKGSLPVGARPVREYVALEDPTGTFMKALAEIMEREGIEVRGEGHPGRTPEGAWEIYAHSSRPMAELVRSMLKYSNNQMAETLLRDVDTLVGGEPGGRTGGLERVRDLLREWEIPTEGLVLADGSGHARANRTTARSLVALLCRAARDPLVGPELAAALPIAGEDGTLATRPFPGLPGGLRAKTGSLVGVHALAGYLITRDGRRAAFALLAEDQGRCGHRHGAEALDRTAAALAKIPTRDTIGPGSRPD